MHTYRLKTYIYKQQRERAEHTYTSHTRLCRQIHVHMNIHAAQGLQAEFTENEIRIQSHTATARRARVQVDVTASHIRNEDGTRERVQVELTGREVRK
jgi:hypothetical protein